MENNIELLEEEIDKLLKYVERLEKKVGLYANALLVAGKFARDNEPGHVPEEYADEYISLYVGGRERDPFGKEFVAFWLSLVK